MEAVSIVGIVLTIIHLSKCTVGVVSENFDPETIPSFNFSDISLGLLKDFDYQVIKEDGQFSFVKTKVARLLENLKDEEEANIKAKEDARKKEETRRRLKEEEELVTRWREEASAGLAFHNQTEGHLLIRKRRQVVNVRIPTLLGHVGGGDEAPRDTCPRAEVLVDDECYQVLTQGPCDDEEVVLIDPDTRRGFCGPRLCPLDKVFLFSDQMCHDPLEYGLCPPGRQLFSNSFGTPVCGCPDGTYEEEDDLDEDVCEPVLGHNDCPPGQVFWFSDFKRPVGCRPDPCKGLNLKRTRTDLPYVPAVYDGKCYQIGKRPFFCKSDELYSISFEQLKGVCTTLEDAGFKVLDSDALSFLDATFGTSSNTHAYRKTHKPASKSKIITPASTTLLRRPAIGEAVMHDEEEEESASRLSIGQSAVPRRGGENPSDNEVEGEDETTPLHTHLSAYSPSYITVGGRTVTFLNLFNGLQPHSRHRRAPLPFVSPGNVFEPGLSACRAGAKRDGNAKCRETVLPSRYPPSRRRRSVPPVPSHPACPQGTFRDLKRQCTASKGNIASSINALGLG
ncbi:uncharacterized protein LOC126999284 isoform X2 [Eriocheir sinensis]|nr:uncharacterized protein LOC126999284 isoform X2 [Eriocheir sinensis]XP_050717650.1 uncharacterized protein LOC126999284 isoform X2 [Eriocheir sinensis]